jgi:anti-sigma regulatory factor (Ser/Thr protein kinase)
MFDAREITVPADLARLREVREFAAAAAGDFGFDAAVQYQLKLVVSEAIANAVVHGSSEASDTVHLRICEEGDALAFYITDRGSTFEPTTRQLGDDPESGRGLTFMAQLMDEFELRPGPGGTVVRFAKRRG